MTPWFQKQAKRPGSRSSSRVESDLLTSPPPSRRDEDASAAATITGLMQNDHGLQAVVDLSDRPHTSSKYDYLFEERGGEVQQYVPVPVNQQPSRSPSSSHSSASESRLCAPSDDESLDGHEGYGFRCNSPLYPEDSPSRLSPSYMGSSPGYPPVVTNGQRFPFSLSS